MRALPKILIALLAAPALAGPFSSEIGGLPVTSLNARAWISSVVSYAPPSAGGGYSKNDAFAATPPTNAVVGRPADFSLASTTAHVLSLGNGGSIIVTFDTVIQDGPGPDFAVFENGFTDYSDWTDTSRETNTNSYAFAELAFVEVGSTTSAWARFPVTYLSDEVLHNFYNPDQNRYSSQDVTLIDGLAGKHIHAQGTPFDLSSLSNDPQVTSGVVDLANIRFIRITDVIGDGSTKDQFGHPIYDPYYDKTAGYPVPGPTAATDGFDLRGIAVLNEAGAGLRSTAAGPAVSWPTAPDLVYQLQRSTDLVNWIDAGSAVTGQSAQVCCTNAWSAGAFFRVKRTPPQP